jgi:hypothetical protein
VNGLNEMLFILVANSFVLLIILTCDFILINIGVHSFIVNLLLFVFSLIQVISFWILWKENLLNTIYVLIAIMPLLYLLAGIIGIARNRDNFFL